MDAALESMRAQVESTIAQRNGAVLLVHFLKTQEGVAAELLLKGGLQVILAAMRAHRGAAELQRWCCEVLAELARHGRKIGVHAIVSQGGVEDLALAMRGHQQNLEVQRWGATALGCMASSGAQSFIEATDKNKVVDIIVSAMRNHPDSTSIQEHGTSALSYIAMDGACGDILSEGGLDAVLTAMRTHSDNAAVQRWGLATMWGIVEDDGKLFLHAFTSLEGFTIVFDALSTFSNCPEVQHWGLVFLRGLFMRCDDIEMPVKVVSEAILAVTIALTHFPDNVDVQERGIATLAILGSSCQREADVDRWTSGLELVTLGVQRHLENVDVQRCGVQAIAILLDARQKSEELDRSIAMAIVAAMTAHPHNLDLQVRGQDVLWTMAQNSSEDDLKLVLEAGSVQAVTAARHAHPNSDELVHACDEWTRALERIRTETRVEEAENITTTATESGEDEGASNSEEGHALSAKALDESKTVVAIDDFDIEF